MPVEPAGAQTYDQEIVRLAETLASAIHTAQMSNVAVVDFSDLQGNVNELGRFVADELSTDLVSAAQGFAVVDRTNLRFILEEQKLAISGLVNPDNTRKLGQLAGVDAIVVGTITPLGETIRISARIIATDTARVVAAGSGSITATGPIRDLMAREIRRSETEAAKNQTALSSTATSQAGKAVPEVGNTGAALSNDASSVGGSAIASLGLAVAELSSALRERYSVANDAEGLVITEVADVGGAAQRGLQVGDVIVEVDHDAVTSPTEVDKLVQAAKSKGYRVVTLLIDRSGSMQWVAVRIDMQ